MTDFDFHPSPSVQMVSTELSDAILDQHYQLIQIAAADLEVKAER